MNLLQVLFSFFNTLPMAEGQIWTCIFSSQPALKTAVFIIVCPENFILFHPGRTEQNANKFFPAVCLVARNIQEFFKRKLKAVEMTVMPSESTLNHIMQRIQRKIRWDQNIPGYGLSESDFTIVLEDPGLFLMIFIFSFLPIMAVICYISRYDIVPDQFQMKAYNICAYDARTFRQKFFRQFPETDYSGILLKLWNTVRIVSHIVTPSLSCVCPVFS